MKTAIKITAIAVITVLAALSCSDGVDLTTRDYSERNDSNKADYTNSPGTDLGYAPVISAPNLIYSSSATAEENKEIYITFPKGADIFKETNDAMTDKLKEFLNFYSYTNPATEPAVYTPSAMSGTLGYIFIRRVDNQITVKLDTVPNSKYFVGKIDAAHYKVFGEVLDFNGDGKGGESYDDLYYTLTVTGGAEMMSYTDIFLRPEWTINFYLSAGDGGFFTNTATSTYITLIDTESSGANNAQLRKIVTDLTEKIEFQKYNQTTKSWAKDGTVSPYEYTGTIPSGYPVSFITDRLFVNITPDDLGIYRVKASDAANLTSKDNYGVKPAKIKINGNYLNNTIYAGPVSYYNNDIRQWETDNPVTEVMLNSDSSRKNVVLDVYFDSIIDSKASTSGEVWLEQLAIDKFNESFKLVYQIDNPGDIIDAGADFSQTNLIELKVTDVKYSASKQKNATNTNNNCITITLDPGYKIDGGRAISLLLSPNFKYTGGHVTFGNPEVANTYYNGIFFWRSYGALKIITILIPGHNEENPDYDPDDPDSEEEIWVDDTYEYVPLKL
jgi:hypothetical protein